MSEETTRKIDATKVYKLKEIVDYQENAIVSREIIRKTSGTMN